LKSKLFLAGGLVLSGCAGSGSLTPQAAIGPRSIFLEGRLAVSIELPSGFTAIEQQGIDTTVGTISGPGTVVRADYGRTGGQRRCGSIPACRQFSRTVDGYPASWIRYRTTDRIGNQTYAERMDFYVQTSGADYKEQPPYGLFLIARCVSSCDVAEQIALSTRFVPRPYSQP